MATAAGVDGRRQSYDRATVAGYSEGDRNGYGSGQEGEGRGIY